MKDLWRDIPGYEGMYQISNTGEVRSFDRYAKCRGGALRFIKGQIIKPHKVHGYPMVMLQKEGNKYQVGVHRLLALAFLPNPDNLPCVNHKSERRDDAFIFINPDGSVNEGLSTIEWCTYQYNNTYGTKIERLHPHLKKQNEKKKKPVVCFTEEGMIKGKYDSVCEAARQLKSHSSNIVRSLKSGSHTAAGYYWKYL